MPDRVIAVNGHAIGLSNLDKILFPDVGFTKGNLIDYYRRIAETMLTHLKGRPLTMRRFPDGIDREGFYQKEIPDYFPDWIRRISIELREEGSVQHQVVCDDAATLVYLANQACITPHIWLSREDKLDHPDKLIFDLDPAGQDFDSVRLGARCLRDALEAVNLRPFLMTTGSRGLHVVVPLDRSSSFEKVRSFARDLAESVVRREPRRLTIEHRKYKRRGRVFVDYLRNGYGATAVSPYAVRARPGAPVAAPLDWDDLADARLSPQRYTARNIFRRLGQKPDPWKDMFENARSLDEPRSLLEGR